MICKWWSEDSDRLGAAADMFTVLRLFPSYSEAVHVEYNNLTFRHDYRLGGGCLQPGEVYMLRVGLLDLLFIQ